MVMTAVKHSAIILESLHGDRGGGGPAAADSVIDWCEPRQCYNVPGSPGQTRDQLTQTQQDQSRPSVITRQNPNSPHHTRPRQHVI